MHIYNYERGEWKLEEVLKEHDLKVTGIDWAPNTNRYSVSSLHQLHYATISSFFLLGLLLALQTVMLMSGHSKMGNGSLL